MRFEVTRSGLYSVNEQSRFKVCDYLEVSSFVCDAENNQIGKAVIFADKTMTLRSHIFTIEDLELPSRIACHLVRLGMSPSIHEDLIFKYVSEAQPEDVVIVNVAKKRPRPF